MSVKGCYGKIPAHGDFVWQGLPSDFVTPWDQWLQRMMAAAQEQSPEHWLEHYLNKAPWRFVIRDRVLGAFVWCGVIIPSVDAVGRYFPFTLAQGLPVDSPLTSVVGALDEWFDQVEKLSLAALSLNLLISDLTREFDLIPAPLAFTTQETTAAIQKQEIRGQYCVDDPQGWMEATMSALLTDAYDQPALWFAHFPENRRNHFLICNGFGTFEYFRA